MEKMKTLTVGETTYEIVDESCRNRTTGLETKVKDLETVDKETKEKLSNVSLGVGNAIKKTVEGAVVTMNDVSPVVHEPYVKVIGKNICPCGTLSFTRNQNYKLDNPIPPGTYTLSAFISSNDTDGETSAISINSTNNVMKYLTLKRNERVSVTFTVDQPIKNLDFCAAYNYSQGEGDSATWSDIQIEHGETATEYEPYINPTTVNVRRCGKNLIPLTTFTSTPSSTTATVKDGILTVKGYLVAHRVSATGLIGKKLTLSCTSKRDGEKGGGLAIECKDASNTKISGVYKQNELSTSVSFTVPENTDRIVVFFYASGNAEESGTAEYRNVLLEVGESVTEYEPYKEETEHTPLSDGTVYGITSLSPNMTIMTDTDGVTIECEYNRDINKVVDSLIKAINDLGGTV